MRALSRIDAPLLAAVFDAEIDAAVERHGDEWVRNLALAWDPLLTDAEMRSLVEQGAGSPHAEKYAGPRRGGGGHGRALAGPFPPDPRRSHRQHPRQPLGRAAAAGIGLRLAARRGAC
jgi:hypothetical protein